MMEYWKKTPMPFLVIEGDARAELRKMPSESIQCCVTSPPYWALRDYGVRGQLGLEQTPEEYIARLVEIFREVQRVLKRDGVLWLNLGDTYAGSSQSWGQKPETMSSMQRSNTGSLRWLKKAPRNYNVEGLKKKDLIGIPWRVALALQADGWYLRSDVIWHKTNPMPESVTDRPTKAHEYIFLLTKSKDYYYDADSIREPHKKASLARAKQPWNGNREIGRIKPSYAGMKSENMCHPKGRNKRSVWSLPTAGFKGAHFATFPTAIPETCIKAGSRMGEAVLDPFAGSGTTLEVAAKLGRIPIGIELKKKYITKFIVPRLHSEEIEASMHKLFGYPGGKWPVRHLIVSAFPPHTTYVDVFGGSAAILLTKEKSDGEVFNDKNEHISNFFRVVKHRPAELAERARLWLHSRTFWNELKNIQSPFDEVEKAFRFWVLLADSFGGRGATFGITRDGIRSVTRARAYLDEVSKRLADVHIENMDFSKVIESYDAPATFFYCDPPYRGTRGGDANYEQLTDDEWKLLREKLAGIKGKFLLSSNPDRFVLKLFKGFEVREIEVRGTLQRVGKNKLRKEVLVSNYKLRTLRKKQRNVVYAKDRELHHVSNPTVVKEPQATYRP